MTPDQWIDFEEMLTPEQRAELGISQDRPLSQCVMRLAGAYRAVVDRLAKATAACVVSELRDARKELESLRKTRERQAAVIRHQEKAINEYEEQAVDEGRF